MPLLPRVVCVCVSLVGLRRNDLGTNKYITFMLVQIGTLKVTFSQSRSIVVRQIIINTSGGRNIATMNVLKKIWIGQIYQNSLFFFNSGTHLLTFTILFDIC